MSDRDLDEGRDDGRGSGGLDGFAELTLETPDPGALAVFYRHAFGCEVLSEEEDRIWLAVGEHARLGLWTPGEKEFGDRGGRHTHYALRVSPGSLDSLVDRLAELGIETEGPVEHDGGDRSLYLEDPEGNVVEVWDFFHRGPGREQGVDELAG
jgi:catechol-2,3-dioxygenase